MNLKQYTLALAAALLQAASLSAQSGTTTCYATLEDGVLRIGNDLIERTFDWNGGNLRTISLEDKTSGIIGESVSLKSDLVPMDKAPESRDGSFHG